MEKFQILIQELDAAGVNLSGFSATLESGKFKTVEVEIKLDDQTYDNLLTVVIGKYENVFIKETFRDRLILEVTEVK
jgi:hypothetical protein